MRLLDRQHYLHGLRWETPGPRRRRLLPLDLHCLQDPLPSPQLIRRRQVLQPTSHIARGALRVTRARVIRAQIVLGQRLHFIHCSCLYIAGGNSIYRAAFLANGFEFVVAGSVI